MGKILGERVADAVLAILLAVIPLLMLKGFELERRISGMEARRDEIEERIDLAIEEIMRIRTGINDLLLPMFVRIAEQGVGRAEADDDG